MPWWIAPLVATGVVIALAAWWWVPKWQANRLSAWNNDRLALATIEDNWRKSISQLIGGAAVLIGAAFAYYQFLGQQQTSHDQLISQQVSKGFEQLGSDNIRVRLGGIYALEGVMNSSEQYHQPVLEALCAFVREGTRLRQITDGSTRAASKIPMMSEATPAKLVESKASKRPPDSSDLQLSPPPTPSPPPTDIQAALTVIGRRAEGKGHVGLSRASLNWSELSDANLVDANLIRADLSRAKLWRANLSLAKLMLANMSLAGLLDANLSRADLTMANLSDAKLWGANLSGAILDSANLSRTIVGNANLSRAYLSLANMSGAILHDANLSGADLSKAKNVSQDQLNKACGDADTKLPVGMTIKPCPSRAPQNDVR